jgi:hypothetical protein
MIQTLKYPRVTPDSSMCKVRFHPVAGHKGSEGE